MIIPLIVKRVPLFGSHLLVEEVLHQGILPIPHGGAQEVGLVRKVRELSQESFRAGVDEAK